MRSVPAGADIRLTLTDSNDLTGQPIEDLFEAPVYATVKEVEREGKENLIEINYMVLYANNGPYNVAGRVTGEHEGDWEHVTARCTREGHLTAVYYGAHRHGDGEWVAAAARACVFALLVGCLCFFCFVLLLWLCAGVFGVFVNTHGVHVSRNACAFLWYEYRSNGYYLRRQSCRMCRWRPERGGSSLLSRSTAMAPTLHQGSKSASLALPTTERAQRGLSGRQCAAYTVLYIYTQC